MGESARKMAVCSWEKAGVFNTITLLVTVMPRLLIRPSSPVMRPISLRHCSRRPAGATTVANLGRSLEHAEQRRADDRQVVEQAEPPQPSARWASSCSWIGPARYCALVSELT